MQVAITRLFRRFNRRGIELEIEEEFCFHIEMLTQGYISRGMSLEAAKDAAAKCFGDAERIKTECAEISRRSHPFMRAMKSFLILLFLTGVLVRLFSEDFYVRHAGDMLIAVAALGRLLLYASGLSPSSFLSGNETSSPLILDSASRTRIVAYNERKRIPIEPTISDE
ncbi:MAG TPA: permease prefix domain 1-containing protein [Pyrinomonadaceae bacterium]|nr:permease prefix domain 1-containing protein [Pyrinomonadaceae bacterium]